ncbi:UxaA family hydrolase [Paraburkholderia sp. CNPSo 3272]|uniref:UxaA family hydrolase n=1 Tax=Paraburkholderia sp. CNPSo 3272 TaxID=2940931 RepID=UPI0035CD0114
MPSERDGRLEAATHAGNARDVEEGQFGSRLPFGTEFALLRRTLAGYARNPNFAAVLFVGLGCEVP